MSQSFFIVIEMVQSTHVQYITKNFIFLPLFESFKKYICILQYIVPYSIFSQKYFLII